MGPARFTLSPRGVCCTLDDKLGLKKLVQARTFRYDLRRANVPRFSLRHTGSGIKAFPSSGGKDPSQGYQEINNENTYNEKSAPAPTLWERLKAFFSSGKIDRERLAKLGRGFVRFTR